MLRIRSSRQMVHRLCAVASALALVVLLSPSSHDGGVVGIASAARREVSPGGEVVDDDANDEYDDDEYDDEDYEEEDAEEEVAHEPVAPVNTKEEYEKWTNSEMTTAMWSLIDRGDIGELAKALDSDPDLVYIRSEDGRGPLFWAYEYERYDLVKLLLDKGADAAAVDGKGNTPVGLMGKDERPPPAPEDGADSDDAAGDASGGDEYEDEYEDEGEEE